MSLLCKNCNFTDEIFPFTVGLTITVLITNILKYTFKVERPSTYKGGRDRYSFPSGHSSSVTFIFLFLFLTFPSIFTFLLFVYMWYEIAYGSYTGGYHRLSEVIAGSILGGGIAIYIVNRRIKE